MLRIKVKKRLEQILLEADLRLPSRGITAIFGVSGSGKSTLINLVSGLLQPDEGKIQLNQRILWDHQHNVPIHQRQIGYVFQDARLFPHYKVKGNLQYGIKKRDKLKFQQIVELLDLQHLLSRYPATLSGGEKQRVAIGRALLTEPELLLMDEPLAALDLPRKQELMGYLEQLAQQINIPILYVTHSLDELIRLAQQVILMQAGKVIAYQPLEQLWQNPIFAPWQQQQNEKSAVLCLPIFEHNSLYHMTALSLDGLGGELCLWVKQLPQAPQQFVRVWIKSSDVSIALCLPQQTSIRNVLFGKISQIQIQRDRVEVEIEIAQYKIWASISKWSLQQLQLQLGQWVYTQIKAVSVI